MITELRPSKEIWKYFSRVNGELDTTNVPITGLQIASGLVDRYAGYHISYSMTELLKDLNLIDKKGLPNKAGKEVMAHYLHEKYHRNREGVVIINPFEENKLGELNG